MARLALAMTENFNPNDLHISPWTLKEKVGRQLWQWTESTIFRFSPRTAFRFRNRLLRCFGAVVHSTAHIRNTVRIEVPWNLIVEANVGIGDHAVLYSLAIIRIGACATISQYAHLCAGSHDYKKRTLPLLRLPISVERDAWVAADAFVGPGVTVGEGAILGARGCAFKNLEKWTIYNGNPARRYKLRERFSE